MALDKKSLKKLRDVLPFGTSLILKKRLFDKYELKFTITYINQVLDPENKKYNTYIIEQAILYAEELKLETEKENERVAAL